MTPTARNLDRAIEVGIIATLLLAPLPFGSVRPWAQIALELLVVLTAALLSTRMLVDGAVTVRLTPLLWPGLAMLALIEIQLLLPGWSASRYATWESARLYVTYLVFLVVLSAHLVTVKRIIRLIAVLVGWGVVLAVWGVVNHALGRELVLWFEKESYRGRLVSTFVNPNHQALYFGILLFLALGMVLRVPRRAPAAAGDVSSMMRGVTGAGIASQLLFAGSAAVLGVALVLTASRAAVFSVATALVLMMALALHGRVRGRWLLAFGAGIVAFVGYVAWVGADALLSRLSILAHEPLMDVRWAIWQGAALMVRDAPFSGIGLGAFQDVFPAYRSSGIGDRWIVDYAHNDYLQHLVEGGVAGLSILVWALVAWFGFVVVRWRERRDPFVRGLAMGGLGAVTVAAVHSTADFGLHIPANGLLLVSVLALVPAVVTLRLHRDGLRVDLRERRWQLTSRARMLGWLGMMAGVTCAGLILVPAEMAALESDQARRLAGVELRAGGGVTGADMARAEALLRRAARLDPSNPRIQGALAEISDELARRVWSYGVTADGARLRSDSPRDRLAASQELLVAAADAYERSLRVRRLDASGHARFGWFLGRLEGVRRATESGAELQSVAPDLQRLFTSRPDLLSRALAELREAVRLDPTSSIQRQSLAMFALTRADTMPSGQTVAAEQFREAIRLDPSVLPRVFNQLAARRSGPDFMLQAVPREPSTLVELARLAVDRGMFELAGSALDDALVVAAAPSDRVGVHIATARLKLRQGDVAQGLAQAQQAVVLAPRDPDAFMLLGDAYDAGGDLAGAESAVSSAIVLATGAEPRVLNAYRKRLVSILEHRGESAAALTLQRQAVEAMPNDAGAHLDLASLLEERGDLAAALREYESARVLGESYVWVQRAVARAYARRGLLREALAAGEQALRLDASDAQLRVEVGDLHARVGSRNRAREEYQLVLRGQPGNEGARRGLSALGVVTE